MKRRLWILVLGALLLSPAIHAQTATEMEAARAMAKSYGYSDQEIDQLLGSRSEGTLTQSGTASEGKTTQESESVLVLKAAQRTDNTEEDPEKQIYGHDFFSNKGLSIIPNINAPTPEGYILGPGDDVSIDIWGSSSARINQVIARDGTILVNGVGPITLAGLTVKRAESTLRSRLSKIYGDLGSGSHLRLSLNRTRSITVNVVGDVCVPGAYALPAMAQVPSALYLAGGVMPTASVRDIRLYRDGRQVGRYDLYAFVFKGEYGDELKLQDGDIISVPSYRAIATVDGAVKRPMRYEILPSDTAADLLTYAGGFEDDAATGRIYLESREGSQDVGRDLTPDQWDRTALAHGDFLYVNSKNRESGNRVNIRGAVREPGLYPISERIPDVKSLIEAAGGLSEEAFKERATLYRLDADKRPTSRNLNLGDILSGRTRVTLERGDSLHVYTAVELADSTTIRIYGEVREEGEYPFRPGMSVYDAILEAGGLTEGADIANIEVARKGRSAKSFVKRLNLVADPEAGAEPLEAEDAIFIRQLRYYRESQTIVVSGEVNYPGTYVIDKNVVRLSDIIERAGGFTSDAYVKGAQLERSITKAEKARMETAIELAGQELKSRNKETSVDSLKSQLKDLYSIGIDLEKALKNPGSEADVVLRTGDVITVPVMNNTVKISGDVFYPNTVVYNPKYSWRDYINQAGGRRRGTKAKNIYAVYMNGQVARNGSANFKMEPGMELVVTSEPKEDRKLSTAEVVTIASSATSIAYMVTALVRMFI